MLKPINTITRVKTEGRALGRKRRSSASEACSVVSLKSPLHTIAIAPPSFNPPPPSLSLPACIGCLVCLCRRYRFDGLMMLLCTSRARAKSLLGGRRKGKERGETRAGKGVREGQLTRRRLQMPRTTTIVSGWHCSPSLRPPKKPCFTRYSTRSASPSRTRCAFASRGTCACFSRGAWGVRRGKPRWVLLYGTVLFALLVSLRRFATMAVRLVYRKML